MNKILKDWAWGLWGTGMLMTAVLYHAGAWSETVGIVVMLVLCVGALVVVAVRYPRKKVIEDAKKERD